MVRCRRHRYETSRKSTVLLARRLRVCDDAPGECDTTSGDRAEEILMQAMNDQVIETVLNRQPHPLLFASISGSHLYGFPSHDSDCDIRGAHILPIEKVVGLYTERETIEMMETVDGVEVDLVTHDIKKYFEMLLGRSGNVLEHIFSPLMHHRTPYFDELREIAEGCITKNHGHAYRGYAESVWDSLGRTPKLKPLLYVFRVLLTGLHLMETGEVESNLMRLNHRYRLPYLTDLITMKLQGSEDTLLDDHDLEFYEREYRRLVRKLDDARMASELPDDPRGKPELHDLLVRLRMEYVQR